MSLPFRAAATTANLNGAYLSRTDDSDTTGIVSLKNASSGGNITNAQQQINDNKTLSEQNETDIATATGDLTTLTSDFNAHVAATDTHGVVGAVVGTQNNQTLQNKTITGVGGNTVSPTEINGQAIDPGTPLAGQSLVSNGSTLAFQAVGSGYANTGLIQVVNTGLTIARVSGDPQLQFLRIQSANDATLLNTPLGDLVSDGVIDGTVFRILNRGNFVITIENNDSQNGCILNGDQNIPPYGMLELMWDGLAERLIQACSPNY